MNKKPTAGKPVAQIVTEIEKQGDKMVDTVTKEVEKTIDPIRKSTSKKFPFLFTLLGTFGVAAVFYSFEVILQKYKLLLEYPWIILVLGIIALYFTGKLYKKLD